MPQALCGLWVALSFFTSPVFSCSFAVSVSLTRFVRTQGVVVSGDCERKRQRNKHHVPVNGMSNLPHYQHKPFLLICVCVYVCFCLSHTPSTNDLVYLFVSLYLSLETHCMIHQTHWRFEVHSKLTYSITIWFILTSQQHTET